MITEYTNYITFFTGAYLMFLAFCMETKNFGSSIIFKIIPFVLGVGCWGVAAKLFNLI